MTESAKAKLQELRGKTDRQLVSLISHRLDRGLAFARVLEDDANDWASTEHFLVNAEKAWHDANTWVSLIDDVAKVDERRLERKLEQLRDAIVRARAGQVRVHAAC